MSLPPTKNRPLPPLQNGDLLTRDEFERRYHAMPHVKKAELIEGVVYMPSPVRWGHHGSPHMSLSLLLCYYKAYTPGVDAGDNATVRLDEDNELQPDATLIIRREYGGSTEVSSDDYLEGAPELVAEVAASSVSHDLNSKLQTYRRAGIVEYILWKVEGEVIDWYSLVSGAYQKLPPDSNMVIRSLAFPGLWIDVVALLRDDSLAFLATLNRGLASPEHAEFVAKLAAQRRG